MRKRTIAPTPSQDSPPADDWLDLEALATVEITSEAPDRPIEAALLPGRGLGGWQAAGPGEQRIRLLFDQPQRVRRIWLDFVEDSVERTQQYVVRWSADGGATYQEVARQQWNFSPGGATRETEDHRADLHGVTVLELAITPEIGGGEARASLAGWRVG